MRIPERGAVLLAGMALLAASALPAHAQTKWNLPAAYPPDNPHTVNLLAFTKEVEQATGGKLQITVHPARLAVQGARDQARGADRSDADRRSA